MDEHNDLTQPTDSLTHPYFPQSTPIKSLVAKTSASDNTGQEQKYTLFETSQTFLNLGR